jgi:hypothetical protein
VSLLPVSTVQPSTIYADGTFASAPLALGNSYTATATRGTDSTSDTVTVNGTAPASFQYDDDGNLTSDGKRQFAYDDEDQFIQVKVTGSWEVDYVYDGIRRLLIRKEYNATGTLVTETHYVYDGMCVIQERDGSNAPQVTYTRGLDLLEHTGFGTSKLISRGEAHLVTVNGRRSPFDLQPDP